VLSDSGIVAAGHGTYRIAIDSIDEGSGGTIAKGTYLGIVYQ
jgi:hypothetical protein